MLMDSLKNILLIAMLELRRAFTTRRGITVIVAFALIWGLLLRYGVYGAAQWLMQPAAVFFLAALPVC